ncbi:DEAD/DEAH box helicase [Phenylobacterium sp.]|uniref:DEAD/DEAH box helicase n=1 Tax=Phenylobacterium sp. TaxID=1871053 RepID=UPI00273734D9|nr:DEAD/DEAH box helicase [Phenylobacterium sp.]MDP3635746.1 DEAD/DEAH box helicase [Phenylobacterium sp.]
MPFPPTHPALERALAAQGYAEPTPVQDAVLAEEAAGRDLLVSAQTGSGKTVAFGLAAGPTLLEGAEKFGPAGSPLALVIAPTRELAMQVSVELTWLYSQTGARVETCVGGMDPRREQRALANGVHIVVGTPGRLKDHLERGNLDLSALRVVVLDEADEMLDMGFREDLEEILDSAPAGRRTLLFSATIAREIAMLAKRYQTDALRIDTVNRHEPHGDIEYRAIRVAPNEVENGVVNVLRFFESPSALVFCNTRDGVRHMHAALRERGFAVVGLSGELGQRERSDALQALRDGQARVCVATDVAARGLDLPDLGLVIHADLPVNKAGLLHRSGRTGRAGKKGVSVLLVSYTRRRKAEQLLASANIEAVWQGPPTPEMIRERDQTRLLEDPILTEPLAEEDMALAKLVLANRTPEEVAAALIRLHRARLPAAEDLHIDPRDNQGPSSGPMPPRADRWSPDREGPVGRPERLDPSEVTWFRINVGRAKNADPKWLIPMICRLGHVTKPEIGSIKIFDQDTKFEIAKHAEAKFAAAVKATMNDEIKIEPTVAPASGQKTAPPRDAPGGERPARSFKTGPRPEYKGKGDGAPKGEGYKGKTEWKGPPKEGGGYKGKPENFKPKGPPKEGGGYKGKAETFKGPPKDGAFKKPFKKNKSNAGPKG